ncbi:MAG TPA: NADH-quinone oxidoreductase subunit J [Thermoanaerobaculia bacterium]|nr:NADH-quinone oxidoreductase subunit J [Thermoanaerobaculia bacterium]
MAPLTATRLVFDVAAGLSIVFASVMVVHRHPVKSVLALVVSFFALSIAYVLLSAPLIAAVQVIVYAGAILVLFLFVLMLLNVPEEARHGSGRPIHKFLSAAAILVFAVALLSLLRAYGSTVAPDAVGTSTAGPADIAAPARLLFSEHLLSFEALSVLLLAALVGAFALARRETHR